jgi:hypothetical protein
MPVSRSRMALAVTAAAVLTAGAAATACPALAAAGGCSIAYTVPSQWGGAFQGTVTVTNLGDAVASWSLTWTFTGGQKVTQVWGAVGSQTGTQVTAKNESWNAALATNGTATFGFIASWNGTSNPVPASFALNGTTCTGDTTPTSTPTGSTTPAPTGSTTPAPTGSTTPAPTTPAPGGVLAQAHTVGRVADLGTSVQYTWPGTSFEGRFHGTGVGVVLNDSNNDYDLQVDGTTVKTLVTPGQTTSWVNGLANTDHTVRLVKRTENAWGAGEFGGFVAAPGGSILARPAPRARQIEFIGDSYTAGYGNLSTTRDCSSNGGVTRNSNADRSFAALTARNLGADHQNISWSGLGMVRNYGGNYPEIGFRAYYDQTLQGVWNSTVWQKPASWKPQLVVIGLGINDFSTALTANEKWSSPAALAADYRSAYQGFLDKLRARYGPDTAIVVSATHAGDGTAFPDNAQQVVKDRNTKGDAKVFYWYYDDAKHDKLGCDWHPSLHDDAIISGDLEALVATLPVKW